MTSAVMATVMPAAPTMPDAAAGQPLRVLLGMSGGLDSTCSALLLKEAGYHVEGASIVMHDYTDTESARRAADEVGIELHILDARAIFAESVMRPFADAYMRGRTPNPCVFCNPAVKFAALHEYAGEHGFDKIATGHYAFVEKSVDGRCFISRAADSRKDQSYALWGLSQSQLAKLILPLGAKDKHELRDFAVKMGLSSAKSAESQEICFIPDNDYAGWLKRERGYIPSEGNFISDDGRILGRHRGVAFYTVGQRKGLGVSFGKPMYVSAIDYGANTVTLTESGGEYMSRAEISGLNFQFLPPERAVGTIRAAVRIRYAANPLPAAITFRDDGAEIAFDTPARAVTPGQSAVAYDGDRLLFGGYIV